MSHRATKAHRRREDAQKSSRGTWGFSFIPHSSLFQLLPSSQMTLLELIWTAFCPRKMLLEKKGGFSQVRQIVGSGQDFGLMGATRSTLTGMMRSWRVV